MLDDYIALLRPEDLRDMLHDASGCPEIVVKHAWLELLKRVIDPTIADS